MKNSYLVSALAVAMIVTVAVNGKISNPPQSLIAESKVLTTGTPTIAIPAAFQMIAQLSSINAAGKVSTVPATFGIKIDGPNDRGRIDFTYSVVPAYTIKIFGITIFSTPAVNLAFSVILDFIKGAYHGYYQLPIPFTGPSCLPPGSQSTIALG